MAQFRKRPVVINATQFDPSQLPWPEGVENVAYHQIEGECVVPQDYKPSGMWSKGRPRIRTPEGWLDVSPGDWIITGIQGERYPCKPDVFAATYEPVKE